MADWVGWHRRYDEPGSTQSRRLVVVRRFVGDALDALGSSARRALSLCAGDGRDLLPELAARRSRGVETHLVERDEALAARASARAASLGLDGVTVHRADAARPAAFDAALPVDLLLLCGIFGNVADTDIRRTVGAVPAMLRAGGFVVWTRGRCEGPDLRPSIRTWFEEVGVAVVEHDDEPEGYGVGIARASSSAARRAPLPDRLFTFFR